MLFKEQVQGCTCSSSLVSEGDISYPRYLLLGSPKSLIFVPILRGKLLGQALSLDQVNNQIRGAHSYAPPPSLFMDKTNPILRLSALALFIALLRGGLTFSRDPSAGGIR